MDLSPPEKMRGSCPKTLEGSKLVIGNLQMSRSSSARRLTPKEGIRKDSPREDQIHQGGDEDYRRGHRDLVYFCASMPCCSQTPLSECATGCIDGTNPARTTSLGIRLPTNSSVFWKTGTWSSRVKVGRLGRTTEGGMRLRGRWTERGDAEGVKAEPW